MTLHFNVTKEARKEMVQTISNITLMEPVYKGVPSCAYVVGNFTIERDGTLVFDERVPFEEVRKLLEELKSKGFTPEEDKPLEEKVENKETLETQDDELTVSMPKDDFTKESLENLKKLVESKGSLMKKVFGASELPILEDEETVSFPWFKLEGDGDALAYTHFIEAICKMAKTQTRITAKDKEVENEKYAFRCFLLRLGFIGKEYKSDRKILLKNLEGSSAFKNGNKEDEA